MTVVWNGQQWEVVVDDPVVIEPATAVDRYTDISHSLNRYVEPDTVVAIYTAFSQNTGLYNPRPGTINEAPYRFGVPGSWQYSMVTCDTCENNPDYMRTSDVFLDTNAVADSVKRSTMIPILLVIGVLAVLYMFIFARRS